MSRRARAAAVVMTAAALTLITVPADAGLIGDGPAWISRVAGQPATEPDPAAACPSTGLPAEAGLTPDAALTLRCAHQKWPDLTIGGVGSRPGPSDHPSGRAIDIMTPGNCSPVGQQIADWAKSSAEQLGVTYVIWCGEIWSVQRADEGWRPNTGHTDHVHISVNGDSAKGWRA